MGDDPDPNSFYDDVDPVEDMRRQLEDLKINLTKKMNKAIKKIPSKPKSSCHKTKSKSRTKKKKLSKRVNAYIVSDESSSDSSDSKNRSSSSETSESSNSESDSEEYEVNATKKKITFSDTKSSKKHKSARPKTSSKKSSNASSDKKGNKNTRPLKIPTDNISLNAFFAILQSMLPSKQIYPPNCLRGSQSEAEILWPNPIEINFICKIIPNDVATICYKISSPLEKIVQVSSAMIDSGQIAQLSQKAL
ncbi:hypothetical protein F8M41_004264 [Gigaspora margarita]|uniref:Uncharacterized protein n=1 Tax=Gigaspora margarita TaxID=4874 RepID=A0A8H3X9Y3_GIGMA|nr:hypothetical protein F8M41_004264 [Gigaspora margarita]